MPPEPDVEPFLCEALSDGRTSPPGVRDAVRALMRDGFRAVAVVGAGCHINAVLELIDTLGVCVVLSKDHGEWSCEVGGPGGPVADLWLMERSMAGEQPVLRWACDPWGLSGSAAQDPFAWGEDLPARLPVVVEWLRSGDRNAQVADTMTRAAAQFAQAGRELSGRLPGTS